MTNTRQNEKSLPYEILGHDVARLAEVGIFAQQPMLQKNCKISTKMKSFLKYSFGKIAEEVCALAKPVPVGSCHKGDLVLLPTNIAAEIWFHAKFNNNFASLVCKYTISEMEAAKICALVHKECNPIIVASNEILSPLSPA